MFRSAVGALCLALMMSASLWAGDHTKDSLETVKKNLNDKKAVIIDVREMNEWTEGHLAQAKLLPLSQMKKGISPEQMAKLAPPGTIVYLHCAAGVRCVQAARMLDKSGRDLRALKPGYDELVEAGFPKAP
jgi:phage shock protein E